MDIGPLNIPFIKAITTMLEGGETTDALREGAKAATSNISPLAQLNSLIQPFIPDGPLKDIMNVVMDPFGSLATAFWPPRDGEKLGDGYATAGDARNADAQKHLTTLSGHFHEIDAQYGMFGYADGLIGRPELEAIASDPNWPADVRDAAKFFLGNGDLLDKLDSAAGINGKDGKIGMEDFLAMMSEVQAGMSREPGETAESTGAMSAQPKDPPEGVISLDEEPETTSESTTTQQAGKKEAGAKVRAESDMAPNPAEDAEMARVRDENDVMVRNEPASSSTTSTTSTTSNDDAGDIVGRLSGKAESIWEEIDRISSDLDKATDPAQIQKLSTQLSQAQSRMQMVTSMLSSVQQLMSNLAKMMHDVQMNAIRNTH